MDPLETRISPSAQENRTVRSVAFYLPQFHPIPENDAWWGQGFTEWRTVVNAQPLFQSHQQPHIPADLGFYDLRLSETRSAQAELAASYGISGFCYYHYWFGGRRLLERPFTEVLSSGQPQFPFCLCWANENWTRTWDGGNREILVSQHYSHEDDLAHIHYLAPVFADPRYIRIHGKPVFAIYAPSQLPDPRRTLDLWRTQADRLGIGELYLCRVESNVSQRSDPRAHGFDAAIEFAPDTSIIPPKRPGRLPYRWRQLTGANGYTKVAYSTIVERMLAKPNPPYLRFPGVCPSWDNSPRRGRHGAVVITGATPEGLESWIIEALARVVPPTPDEDILFVNAWNEWGEGAHLEPDQHWGRAWLEAHRRALASVGRLSIGDANADLTVDDLL